jgi:hypothetical protein
MMTNSAIILNLLYLAIMNLASSALSSSVKARATTGDVTATWSGENWRIPVTFGGNQPLSLVLDTGSGVL